MAVFETILNNMKNMGFFQYVFPFLLALGIIFGILEWSLGGGGKAENRRLPKSVNALISLILAFFVMLFVSVNSGIVLFLQNISGYFLVIGSGILFLIILLGLVGIKIETQFGKGNARWILVLVIIAIALVIFFGAGGEALVGTPGWASNSELWTIVFFVAILALVLALLGKEKDQAAGGEKTGG